MLCHRSNKTVKKSRPTGERSRTLLRDTTDTPVAIFYLPESFTRKLVRTGHGTVQGETIRFPRELEQRKPRLLSRFPGWLPFRYAARTFCAELSQLPPRMTRFADDSSRALPQDGDTNHRRQGQVCCGLKSFVVVRKTDTDREQPIDLVKPGPSLNTLADPVASVGIDSDSERRVDAPL